MLVCVSLAMYTVLFSSCKSDDIDGNKFEIAAKDLILDEDKEATTVYVPINTSLSINDWEVAYDASWITHGKKRNSLALSFEANPDKTKRTATIKISSPSVEYTLTVNQYGENDVVITDGEGIQVMPASGNASEPAGPNNGIENTWNGSGRPYMTYSVPATLEYFFSGAEVIDCLTYIPTTAGSFGNVKIYTATAAQPDYVLQGEYDFEMKSAAKTIQFASGLKATKIKFEVESGSHDMVGCLMMNFYTKVAALDEQLLKVFTDITCTEVKPDADENTIEQLPNEYFKRIAYNLKDGRYDEWEKEFRIQEYKPYSNNYYWQNRLRVKRYSDLDNPTGICVNEGDEVIVLVGDTHGQYVYLKCIGEETATYEGQEYLQPQLSSRAATYNLEPGINKLTMTSSGQLFVMYISNDLSTQPIKIHIPLGSGKVTGYFDIDRDKTDEKYCELLKKATHKYFCVRGSRIMFYFHTSSFREVIPKKILPALNLWNSFVELQQELAGFDAAILSQMNNHIFAMSPEGNYMWANDERIAFARSTLSQILIPEKVLTERNMWGIVHELGHVHQNAINWPSCTESSNNLFANYALYKLNNYCSRGAEISQLADSYRQKKAWVNLGTDRYQGEATEIHLRMFWQLWNYFHRLGNMTDFYPKLFNELRSNPYSSSIDQSTIVPGRAQLQFAKAACKVANMDMTDFFERWGFFRPVLIEKFEQYYTYRYEVTQQMIDDTKVEMATYSKKMPPICYLEDRKNSDVGIEDYKVGDVGYYTQFKDNAQIIIAPTYRLSGREITVNNGTQAVAFEVRRGSEAEELQYFFNFLTYQIPPTVTLDANTKFYAVQADGKRVEMRKE